MFSVVLAVSNASGHPTNLRGSDVNVKDVSLAPYINQSCARAQRTVDM